MNRAYFVNMSNKLFVLIDTFKLCFWLEPSCIPRVEDLNI